MVFSGLIVDTNIIFSCFQKDGIIRKLLFLIQEDLYAPNFLFFEIFKYKEKILKNSNLDSFDISEMASIIFNKIFFVNEKKISKENRLKAYDYCRGIDENDSIFIALSLELNIPLWSGDKKLYENLKEKISIFNTNDIKALLNINT